MRGLSLVAASRPCSQRQWEGFSLCWFLLWKQALGHTGLVALGHVESSWTRDQIRFPCIGRWMLNHWTTREILILCILDALAGS